MDTDEHTSPQSAHVLALSSSVPQDTPINNAGFIGMIPTPEALMPEMSPNTWRQLLPIVRPRPFQDDFRLNNAVEETPAINDEAYITIPVGHHTTTSSLFSLQPIRRLVGYYPPGFFYDIERSQPLASQSQFDQGISFCLAELDLGQEKTTYLISNYFMHIHPKFPVVDQPSFPKLFEKTFRGPYKYDADLAICLLVLALGDLISTESVIDPVQEIPGIPYFSVAYRVLMMQWAVSFEQSLSLPTGQILAAVYLCFKAQPLAAWKMTCMASNSLQLLAQESVLNVLLGRTRGG